MNGVRKLCAVAVKELRQIGRDRRTLLILLFVPAFFLLLYGYALNFDIRNIRAGRAGRRPQHAPAARSSRRSSTPATSIWSADVDTTGDDRAGCSIAARRARCW